MKLKKTILALSFASLMMQAGAAPADGSGTPNNPLLQRSTLTFGAPDFSKIKETDYLPAIEWAIQRQREEVSNIVNNKQKPTFENTILALEKSGVQLDYAVNVFDGIANAHKTPTIAETERKVMPMLAELGNEINFNEQLFQRIKYVYDKQYKKLKGEDKRLTEVVYKQFVRSGALLTGEKKERMKQ
ncbi:MAG: dipeptidyl carboxypeptidase II, partial [Prevotella sp.]|nr:dipeptidyl carboxypeptidase II [Prevotella sp.]